MIVYVPRLKDVLTTSENLTAAQSEWLHLLVGDWQTIADLSFSDLVLYIPVGEEFRVGAQTRPATAATLIEGDLVGEYAKQSVITDLRCTMRTLRIMEIASSTRITTFVPVVHQGVAIAVLQVLSAKFQDRAPSQRYLNYEDIAAILMNMIASGEFPMEGTPTGFRHGTPRVSDGLIHINEDGVVLYASPNSVSHYRRLGIKQSLVGLVLAEAVAELIEDYSVPDESLPLVLMGRAAWMTECNSRGVVISMRALPLKSQGQRLGAVLLTRDITELRRQEKQLLTKDATIREINHRVKNNLQTVSALLRLQGRRATNTETKQALEQAQRRVSMIAIVHEGLSQNIDEVVEFDEVFGNLLRTVRDIAVTDYPVDIQFFGTFGQVRAAQATTLAVVLNEVISNSIEHGLPNGGVVEIHAQRAEQLLTLRVLDNGTGIGDKEPGGGLGTQIVQSLVQGELNGKINWKPRLEGGTEVLATIRLQ